jgi:hypothetical protein
VAKQIIRATRKNKLLFFLKSTIFFNSNRKINKETRITSVKSNPPKKIDTP